MQVSFSYHSIPCAFHLHSVTLVALQLPWQWATQFFFSFSVCSDGHVYKIVAFVLMHMVAGFSKTFILDCKRDMEEYSAQHAKEILLHLLSQNHMEITINSRSWHNMSHYFNDFSTYWFLKVCTAWELLNCHWVSISATSLQKILVKEATQQAIKGVICFLHASLIYMFFTSALLNVRYDLTEVTSQL